jgi:hypothetical protein
MKISTPFLSIVLLLCAVPLPASDGATLSFYNPRSRFVYYHGPGLTMQAARFETPAPGSIRSVTIMMGGDSTGHARLHVFGHEGGLPVPILERDLIAPVLIEKKKPGVMRIVVDLPSPVFIPSNQFFIAVDGMTPGVTLLSDDETKQPSCASRTDRFYYQFLKYSDDNWRSAPYAYAITVAMDYRKRAAAPYLTDVTAQTTIDDSLDVNRSIAWADVNGDGRLDLLVNGRLYANVGDGSFHDITAVAGISGAPRANVFIDADNDGRTDILFLGSGRGDARADALFVNDGHGGFTPHRLSLPGSGDPTCFAIADANGDGLLDLFVGLRDSAGAADDRLLLNDGRLGFTDGTALLHAPQRGGASLGAEWVDVDNDGVPELFVARESGPDMLWKKVDDSTYRDLFGAGGAPMIAGRFTGGMGCDWIDYDNDGDVDLYLPTSSAQETGGAASSDVVFANHGAPGFEISATGSGSIEYEARRMGGAWGDVNNDGLPDLIATTSCACRYAALYLQSPDHRFDQRTAEYGLRRTAAGPDAVWVDYDNDGRLDLATFVDGRFRLFRNGDPSANNYIELDLADVDPVGAGITVYAGGIAQTQTVSSGRGLLMQKPFRLHFGLGGATRIDSVVVRRGAGVRRLTGLAPNGLYRIDAADAGALAADAATTIDAAPNPFSDQLRITYTLPVDEPVRLEIYSVEGVSIQVLTDEQQHAGEHTVVWDAKDQEGRKLPQGIYAYRLKTAGADIVRKVVLTR